MSQSQFKLVSHYLCPYVQRSLITLDEKNIEHEREYIDLGNKPEWFVKRSPLGKVPLLLTEDSAVFESAVICEYLDEITPGSLHPESTLAKAHNRSWIEFGSSILANIAGLYGASSKTDFQDKVEEISNKFSKLEVQMGDGDYFNGDHFSMVDAAFGPIFRYFEVFENFKDFGFFDKTPKVKAWRERVMARPSVKRAVSENYPLLLKEFLLKKNSHLSQVIAEAH